MRGKRMTIFVDDTDRWKHASLYTTILEHLRSAGCAGATVTRGIAGFGEHSRIKTTALVELAIGLPIVITVVDLSERVERVLPEIAAMLASGTITVEDTEIYFSSAAFKGGIPELRVAEVMHRQVETVSPETPLAEVVERLLARDYTALPVLDVDGRVVGMVADRDLLRSGTTPLSLSLQKVAGPELVQETLARLKANGGTVAGVMTTPAVSVTLESSLREAARLMHERGLKRLPVVDGEMRLVGVLGRLDVLNAIVSGHARRTVPVIHRLPQEHRTVAEVMERDVPTVFITTPLTEVVDKILASQVKRVMVLDDDNRLAGIIADSDIVARADAAERPGLLTSLRSWWSEAAKHEIRRARGQRAADIMTTPAVAVPGTATVIEALALTVTRHLKRLPVVDTDGRVLGIVSRPALLAASLDLADSLPSQ